MIETTATPSGAEGTENFAYSDIVFTAATVGTGGFYPSSVSPCTLFIRTSNTRSRNRNEATSKSRSAFTNFPSAREEDDTVGLRKFTTKTFANSINEGKTLRIVSRVIRP